MTSKSKSKSSKNSEESEHVSEEAAEVTPLVVEMPSDDDFERGTKVSGGFEGPSWVPMLTEEHEPELKPEAIALKIRKAGPGSFTTPRVKGVLVQAVAWDRGLYFLDVKSGNGERVRVKLPESALLYKALGFVAPGSAIALRYDGRGKSKDGRKPPHLYTVTVLDGKALTERRSDALTPESKEVRERRKAAEENRRAREIAEASETEDEEI